MRGKGRYHTAWAALCYERPCALDKGASCSLTQPDSLAPLKKAHRS